MGSKDLSSYITAFAFILLYSVVFSCKSSEPVRVKDEFEQIKTMLDKALLSNDPQKSFSEALPKVRKFSTVDSAWIESRTFLVKFKSGGIVSWIITDNNLNKISN
ncbi:MAG: hypothetical protein WCO02_12885 [Bacteroidota bacterium]